MKREAWRGVIVFAVVLAGALAAMGPGPAGADVTGVTGSAFGVSIQNLTIFGGAQPKYGPKPTVTLPAAGSATPVTGTDPSEKVSGGPATFLESGLVTVSTQGTVGATGSVTSTATLNQLTNASGEQLTADSLASTCTANQSGVTGSTTVTNGKLVTATDASQNPTTTVEIPASPAPNTRIDGSFQLGATDTESFTWFFNEQTTNPDGSITVTAAHERLNGPTATPGDLYLGQVVCGVTVPGGPTTSSTSSTSTTSSTTTSTTAPPQTTTTAPPAGQVGGGAFGYSLVINLFGGQTAKTEGPTPTVSLPPAGSATPITAGDPSETIGFGPATFFESKALSLSTEGVPGGTVKSSATIDSITDPHGEQFTADRLASTCTADQSGASGSVSVTNGKMVTSTDADQNPTNTVTVPANPGPNTRIDGSFVLGPADTESFTWIFNEQVTSAGSVTVNAAHEILHGPTAKGELIVGQVRCATTAAGASTATVTAASGRSGGGLAATGADVARQTDVALWLILVGATAVLAAGGRPGGRRLRLATSATRPGGAVPASPSSGPVPRTARVVSARAPTAAEARVATVSPPGAESAARPGGGPTAAGTAGRTPTTRGLVPWVLAAGAVAMTATERRRRQRRRPGAGAA
ncbi:MAG: choice-of-anchor P family protein [Acidimicrobiales bacterium]